MIVLILCGALTISCGMLLLISPKTLVKLGEIANHIFMVDNFPIRHHVLTGIMLVVVSVLLFLIGLAVGR